MQLVSCTPQPLSASKTLPRRQAVIFVDAGRDGSLQRTKAIAQKIVQPMLHQNVKLAVCAFGRSYTQQPPVWSHNEDFLTRMIDRISLVPCWAYMLPTCAQYISNPSSYLSDSSFWTRGTQKIALLITDENSNVDVDMLRKRIASVHLVHIEVGFKNYSVRAPSSPVRFFPSMEFAPSHIDSILPREQYDVKVSFSYDKIVALTDRNFYIIAQLENVSGQPIVDSTLHIEENGYCQAKSIPLQQTIYPGETVQFELDICSHGGFAELMQNPDVKLHMSRKDRRGRPNTVSTDNDLIHLKAQMFEKDIVLYSPRCASVRQIWFCCVGYTGVGKSSWINSLFQAMGGVRDLFPALSREARSTESVTTTFRGYPVQRLLNEVELLTPVTVFDMWGMHHTDTDADVESPANLCTINMILDGQLPQGYSANRNQNMLPEQHPDYLVSWLCVCISLEKVQTSDGLEHVGRLCRMAQDRNRDYIVIVTHCDQTREFAYADLYNQDNTLRCAVMKRLFSHVDLHRVFLVSNCVENFSGPLWENEFCQDLVNFNILRFMQSNLDEETLSSLRQEVGPDAGFEFAMQQVLSRFFSSVVLNSNNE